MSAETLISTIATTDLVGLLDTPERPFLLDVREPDEVAEWSIPGVVNIPLGTLAERLDEVPTDESVVVICAKGARAQSGAEILAAAGRPSAVLVGGMGAWASTYDTAHGWTITHVLDTHLHADHISGARSLVEATGAQLLLSPSDPFEFNFTPLTDGLRIELTSDVALTVSAVSVPGHTEGSTMYQLGEAAIFTGDTLFLESVGRPDLADQAAEFAENLYRSLHERILTLGDDTMVFPAHYGAAVPVVAGAFVARPLGELRSTLPALALSEADFVAWAIANVTDRPPNYQRIVRINAGRDGIDADAAEMELGPNRCAIA